MSSGRATVNYSLHLLAVAVVGFSAPSLAWCFFLSEGLDPSPRSYAMGSCALLTGEDPWEMWANPGILGIPQPGSWAFSTFRCDVAESYSDSQGGWGSSVKVTVPAVAMVGSGLNQRWGAVLTGAFENYEASSWSGSASARETASTKDVMGLVGWGAGLVPTGNTRIGVGLSGKYASGRTTYTSSFSPVGQEATGTRADIDLGGVFAARASVGASRGLPSFVGLRGGFAVQNAIDSKAKVKSDYGTEESAAYDRLGRLTGTLEYAVGGGSRVKYPLRIVLSAERRSDLAKLGDGHESQRDPTDAYGVEIEVGGVLIGRYGRVKAGDYKSKSLGLGLNLANGPASTERRGVRLDFATAAVEGQDLFKYTQAGMTVYF